MSLDTVPDLMRFQFKVIELIHLTPDVKQNSIAELANWSSFSLSAGLEHLGYIINGTDTPYQTNHCFLYDTSVQMWPLDPMIKPNADGSYDEEQVLSKVRYKQQNQIEVGDLVVSYEGVLPV